MKNFTNNYKQFTSRLSARWLIMALMMLVGTSSAWAWGWVVRCTDSQASENPSFYLGDEATFYWCFNGDGSDATYKRTCISTSSSSAGTWEDNVEWIKNGCDGNNNQAWKASFKLTSTGTKYYSLWLGWGKSVGDNGRYYNGSSSWSEGSDKFSSSKFTVNELPNPTDQTHSLSGTTATLTWTKNTTYTTVLVVRYAKGATATQPTGGTSYSTNSAIGNGTVIYKGTDGSCTNTITAGNSYDYYFYTVNNNYYSSGVKTTLEGCTTPNFSVSLPSNGVVNKGDENITASITVIGTPSPAVTWSSSKEEVATIDALGNITAIKFGQTTITATTTGDGGFCENVPQSTTLTVKETLRVSITGENTICEGQTVTLTASITDLSDGNEPTINWYKEGEDDIKKTGATYEPESTGKYYVIVTGDYINRTESGKSQFTVNENPTIQSTLDNNATNVEICGTGNETTLSVTEGLASYSWGDGNTKTVNETGTYTVTATDANGCTSNEVKFNVKVLNPTVEFVGDNEQTVCPGATANFEVVLAQGQSVSWKDADGAEVSTSNPFTQIIEGEAGTTYTYKVVISEGSCSSAEGTVTATIPAINLTVGSISGDNEICSGNATTLTLTGMVDGTVEKWLKSTDNNNYSDVSNTTTTLNTGNLTTSTYYKALVSSSVCPNHKEPTEAYLVTVNPKPTISIGDNTNAVKFEDVKLTATGNNIDDVTWTADKGTITVDATDPKKAILTYDQTGTVTVTAKAISAAGCESAEVSKKVTFGEEDCADVETTTTNTTRKTKITYAATKPSGWSDIYCYAWNIDGDTPITKAWPGNQMVKDASNKYVIVLDIDQNVEFKVKFNQGNNDKQSTNDSEQYTGGYLYSASTITGKPALSGSTPYTETTTTTTTTPAPVTAPAVKMVSAEYDEVNDKIVAKGAVYKTGCGTTFWGFQYSTDGQKWGTEEIDYIRPNSGNSLTKAGEFEYSFAIPKAGGGDIYYIRAYALNNYKGSYALSNAVYSATSLPVEIPSSTIESATISLVDSEGNATEVCPQSTVYLKVSYVGGDFKSFEAADNFPGTNLELVNHDKAKNEAIFSYTATATGIANITISNDNTSITTTNGVKITLKNVAPVNAPMISISQATICAGENGSATITVNNPIEGLTYTLYKETKQIGNSVNFQTGDLTFNVTEAGSYTVRAEEGVCNNYANSMAVELKVVTSDVKIGLAVDKTTINPWQPLKLTVTAPEGYAYTIDALNDVVYTQTGNVYTVKIPRPTDQNWPIKGNSGKPVKTKDVTFEAKIQVTDDLTCGSSSITVKLEDTEENCK